MSKIIILYGPPSVGKLTIALALEVRLKNFKVFHNHLAVDYAEKIFDKSFETGVFVQKLRVATIKEAVNRSVNLIITIAYDGTDKPNTRLREWVDVINQTDQDSKIYFVKLLASKDELYKRVEDPERKNFGKINTASSLSSVLENEGNYFDSIPFIVNSAEIENTNLTPKETVEKILRAIPELEAH